jgi:class 3 adenylate cyclase
MPYIFQVASTASEDRLEKLMAERLKPGANKAEIDERIWDLFGETWAVMFTDLAGFSRRVEQFGIIHFLQIIFEAQRLLIPTIDRFDGILLKMEGDSMLVIFRRAVKAIECAIEMQRTLKTYNTNRLPEEQVLLCVGLGYGRMLRIGDNDVYGPEVNAASKLGEDTAEAWEILATDAVKKEAEHMMNVKFEHIKVVPPGAERAWRVEYMI